MLSRPASPSQPRAHVESMYHVPTYNLHALHDSQTPFPPDPQNNMGRSHNSLDIVLASDCVVLRGTGVDVEPCTLRGNVVLTLVEATIFKEITMQFKGKSRVPQLQNDSSSILGASHHTSVIYFHDWSFLEGERKHSPTLKAGRHVFPFQLQLEGHLPSSLFTHGGEGGINYKLRATAVRPVFASNLHAAASVRIVRSFATEALEYQQTLEHENTWPEKIMYSLLVPHKAWAAGDTIITLAKFSPLLKGVHVASITTTIQEHMKTFTKSGPLHDTTRVIATAKHEIRNRQAESIQLNDPARVVTISRRPTPPWTAPSSPVLSGIHAPEATFPMDPFPVPTQQVSNSMPTPLSEGSMLGLSVGESEQHPSSTCSEDNLDIGEEEIVTTLPIFLPTFVTPSHPLEPIIVTHRIRWTVSITNHDGHMSELRCSLPLHILDHALLEDTRLATCATRRLLFGLDDAQPHSHEELELPSYPAHTLDRIANAHDPPSTMDTSNLLVSRPDIEPSSTIPVPGSSSPRPPLSQVGSRATTPNESSSAVALDWVSSELHTPSPPWQRPANHIVTPPDSTQSSRHASRASSRAASPERGSVNGRERHNHNHHSIFSLKPFSKVTSSFHPGQGKNHTPAAASDSTTHTASATQPLSESSALDVAPGGSGSASLVLPRGRSEDSLHATALLNGIFSEVPDYDVALCGFLGGGVTPLSSIRGLPSYEEAERSLSEGDLAARFAAAQP